MPTIVHSIGSFTFIDMTPVPPLRRRKLLVETRPGVDGVAIWWDGERGEIWRPRTVRDAVSHVDAQLIKQAYEDAVGVGTVAIVYAGSAYPNAVIADVQVVIEDQLFGVGGFTSAPQALVRAAWDILIL
jgi:hypothetical protein